MTRVLFRLAVPSPDGVPIPATGEVIFRPSHKRTVFGDPDESVLPKPFAETIGPGGQLLVELAPSGPDWAWELRFVVVGMRRWTEYVAVPDLPGDADYEDLIQVDPKTLLPTASPSPVWYGYALNVKVQSEEAQAAAAEARAALALLGASAAIDSGTGLLREDLIPARLSPDGIQASIDDALRVIDCGTP